MHIRLRLVIDVQYKVHVDAHCCLLEFNAGYKKKVRSITFIMSTLDATNEWSVKEDMTTMMGKGFVISATKTWDLDSWI